MHRVRLTLLALGLLFSPPAARADVFHLANGGRLLGREVPADPPAADVLTIELRGGGRVQIARSSVTKQERSNDILDEYQRRARATPATAEAQWELAEWCRTNQLDEQRTIHLQRLLKIDPDHIPARRALGYFQFQGKWMTREEIQQRAGYVLYQGRWRTRQEVQLMIERKAARAAHVEWTQRLKRWRRNLVEGDGREVAEALDHFSQINDPVAVDPLTALICAEPIRPLRLMYIRVLCGIDHPRAVHQLTYLTLVDRDEDVFDMCMREVVQRRQPETIKAYLLALKNADNFCVNRAARSLAQLEDPAAIGPLIDALITAHPVATPRQRTPAGVPAGKSTITFATDAEGKSTPVPERQVPPVIFVRVPNQDVLSALVTLSEGMSFGFDQQAWSRWHAAQKQQMQTAATSREAPE